MSVPYATVLQKMTDQINLAKEHIDQPQLFKQHISQAKLLCELILEEASEASSVKPLTQPDVRLEEAIEATKQQSPTKDLPGDSIFDF